MYRLFYILIIFFGASHIHAQSITGMWKTIDEETGKAKAQVEIFEKGGKYHGKIVKVLDPDAPRDATCRDCPGGRNGKPIEGLTIITGLEKQGDKYKDGEILDPENGKVYDCKVWLNEDNPDLLMVRGYLLFLYRTQTWERM